MIRIVPWILAAATAVWFDRMARRAGRNRVAWTVGGALFALVIATIVLGVGQATSIPFSASDRTRENIEWTVAAVLVVGVLGWLCTIPLHGEHLRLWHRIRGLPPPSPQQQPSATTPAQKPKPESAPSAVQPASGKPAPPPKQKVEASKKG